MATSVTLESMTYNLSFGNTSFTMSFETKAKTLDQFFTKDDVAQKFVETVDRHFPFDGFDFIVEPSMGEGAIFDFLPRGKRRGIDIQKMHDECLEMNFLNWHPEMSGIPFDRMFGVESRILFIGNPPFGSNSSLSVEFFKHAAKFGSVIAFLVPRTWRKFSVQNRLPMNWALVSDEALQDDSFIFEGEPYSVRCCEQIWAKQRLLK